MQIITLYEREEPKEQFLTPELQRLYGGDLSFPEPHSNRPYVIGNFVETIDGVVSFRIPGRSGGGEISGGSDEDRLVMGLLRSVSDAVLVGSRTFHGDPGHVRIPAFIYPEAKDLYAELRMKLGKPALPLNVILTASGKLDLNEPTFHTEGLLSDRALRENTRFSRDDTVVWVAKHQTSMESSTPSIYFIAAVTARYFTAAVTARFIEHGPHICGFACS
jgi:hypothetical protein